ncbi:MAG: antA/AntB antirepressor family protein [Anaerocolumna sp.]
MNQLINKPNQTPIEIALGIDGNGMTTARKLYEFLELNKTQFSRWAKTNIENNEFYEEGIDWVGFDIVSNGNDCKDYKLTTDFAKHLSMESHSSKGKIARNYFVGVEDKLKEVAIQVSSLPPEMQMFKSIFDQQAKQYIEMQQLKADNQKVIDKVESIKEVISLDTTSWRNDTGNILRKIGVELGSGQAFSQVRSESYELLNKRMGVDLQTRLTNKRRRMADNGVCKSTRDKLSYVDIIAEDKKLIEGYTAIVKEMAIKYGVA